MVRERSKHYAQSSKFGPAEKDFIGSVLFDLFDAGAKSKTAANSQGSMPSSILLGLSEKNNLLVRLFGSIRDRLDSAVIIKRVQLFGYRAWGYQSRGDIVGGKARQCSR